MVMSSPEVGVFGEWLTFRMAGAVFVANTLFAVPGVGLESEARHELPSPLSRAGLISSIEGPPPFAVTGQGNPTL